MMVHNVNIFAKKDLTPNFESLSTSGKDIVLRLHSGDTVGSPPSIIIFFANQQEAVNFKNAVIQSWEAFLKKEV